MPKSKKATILIVDDIPANITLLLNTLRDTDFHVLVAESGESALERLKYFVPDIILLDVAMPGMNGFQTCQRIKRNPNTADIPILFLTSHDETVNKVHGFQVGGVDYITKPIQIEEVIARVKTHITLSQLQQEAQAQNEILEARVLERTAELQAEIEQRKRNEIEKQKLLNILGTQSDQLSEMTQWLIGSQQQRHNETYITLQENMADDLSNIILQLHTYQNSLAKSSAKEAVDFDDLQSALIGLNRLQSRLQNSQQSESSISAQEREILDSTLLKLTAREREVLQLIVDGKSTSGIAELLSISETTIRSHRSHIMQKLDIEDSSALIKFAIRHGLTTL